VPLADLILPGFYGKLPSAGDFVTRRLPHDFVLSWDRWLAKQIAPLISSEQWNPALPLRFISGASAFGPAAGIIAASNDRVGRRFPLSLVALLPTASVGIARQSDAWFATLEDAAAEAHRGLTPDELEARLSALGLALDYEDKSQPVDGMVAWTADSDLYDLDPAQPYAILHQLLVHSLETS